MDMPETTAVGPHQWGGLKIRRENLKKRQIIKKCVFIPDMKAVSVWECLRVQGVSYTVLESVFEQAIIRVCCIIDLQNDNDKGILFIQATTEKWQVKNTQGI